jgi:hypothetical protein
MQRPTPQPEKLPDPWLFDTEALLRELDRCRETVLQIPITNPNATHFGIQLAVSALWNLTENIRYLLHLHREGQRQIARAHTQNNPTPAIPRRDKKIVSIATEPQRASVPRKTVGTGAPLSRGRTARPRTTSHAA